MLGAGFKPVVRYSVSWVGSTPTGFRQTHLPSVVLRPHSRAVPDSRACTAWETAPTVAQRRGKLSNVPGLSACARNLELLQEVVSKLDEITKLSQEQADARKNGDPSRATELDSKLDLIYAQKERSVGAWQQHVRDHGC